MAAGVLPTSRQLGYALVEVCCVSAAPGVVAGRLALLFVP